MTGSCSCVEGHSIDYVEWVVRCRNRCAATYADSARSTGLARAHRDVHTRELALHQLLRCQVAAGLEVLRADRLHGTREVALAHRAVTYYDDFLEVCQVIHHLDADVVLVSKGNGLCLKAHKRCHEFLAPIGNTEGEVTVHVGHRTQLGTLDHYIDTCKGFRLCVSHLASNGARLCQHHLCHKKHQDGQRTPFQVRMVLFHFFVWLVINYLNV